MKELLRELLNLSKKYKFTLSPEASWAVMMLKNMHIQGDGGDLRLRDQPTILIDALEEYMEAMRKERYHQPSFVISKYGRFMPVSLVGHVHDPSLPPQAKLHRPITTTVKAAADTIPHINAAMVIIQGKFDDLMDNAVLLHYEMCLRRIRKERVYPLSELPGNRREPKANQKA